ncbi:hypothetical protein D3C72_1340920 [compost metagenome]
MHILARAATRHGSFVSLDARQALLQVGQALVVESGADLAGIAQFPAGLVDGQQQRTQPHARALGRRVANDGELLALGALDLDPAVRAARHVRRRLALGHDSLQAHLAGGRHQVGGRHVESLAEPQALIIRRGFHQLRQQRPPYTQGLAPQIPPADERQIEGIEDDVLGTFAVEGILQRLEAGHAVLVQNDDLPIDPGGLCGQFAECFDQMRKLRAPVMAVARVETQVGAVDPDHQPIAVELHLIQPILGVARDGIHQCCKLRLKELGQFGGLAGQSGRRVVRRRRLPAPGLPCASPGTPQGDHAVGHFVHDAELALGTGKIISVLDQ